MLFIAQGALVVFFGLILFLGFICLAGVYSFIRSFTKSPRHWSTLACAVPAFVFGFWFTVTNGMPKPGSIYFAYYMSWANLLFGTLGIVRWMWHGRK